MKFRGGFDDEANCVNLRASQPLLPSVSRLPRGSCVLYGKYCEFTVIRATLSVSPIVIMSDTAFANSVVHSKLLVEDAK